MKKWNVWNRLPLFCCSALLLMSVLVGAAQAAVSVANDKYLYFGRWNHLLTEGGSKEASPRPVLWQKVDDSLYWSVYLVDKQVWGTSDGSLLAWDDSDNSKQPSTLRPWLNTDNNGFFKKAFTTDEQDALNINVDGDIGAHVTLRESGIFGQAAYIDAPASYALHWTRSPSGNNRAWAVVVNGNELGRSVDELLGVRPACSINLGSVIFKSLRVIFPAALLRNVVP